MCLLQKNLVKDSNKRHDDSNGLTIVKDENSQTK